MEVARYSPSGEYLGVSGGDGRLKIWDTSSNVLKQEFVPSSHLTATCTCLEWAPGGNQPAGKKKKRKRTVEGDVLAMGTATGALLMYGVTKAQLLSHSKDAHSGRVTGLSWSSNSLLLYSCGEDGYIHEWDPESTKSTSHWRGNKSGLSAIRVFEDRLLSAGHGITLWDLETKTPAMNFTGHPSLITQLEVIPGTEYFVTMCHTERHLRIWSANEKNSVLTLTVPEPPQSFSVRTSTSGQVAVSSSTQKGLLHMFKHKLNGPVKKPLLPSVTVKVLDSLDDSKQVAILASQISNDEGDEDMSILLSYGNWLRPRFERFATSSLEPETIIKREYSVQKKKGRNRKTVAVDDADMVEIPDDVKHLQPGFDRVLDSKTKKRRNEDGEEDEEEAALVDDGELPMEERLTNLAIESAPSTSVPSASNLANLLSQGLHSKDVRIMQSVLCRWDEDVISTTVRSLPVQLIIPLLNEIRKMLGGKAQQHHSLLKWLKNIFQIHSAYLMACPSSEELLGPFLSLLKSRETLYPQMCQLKGKLELIKGNIQAKEYKSEQPNQALLVYQDESSDDEREEDTFLPSESEGYLETDEDLDVDDEEEEVEGESEAEEDDSDDDESEKSSSESEEETKAKSKKSKTNAKTKKPKVNNHVAEDSDDLMDAE